MIMAGTSITSAADPLRKIQEEFLFHSLVRPKPDLEARMRQLRVAYQIDPKLYSVQKRSLPYVVCGIFNPPYRRTENFAYIENFIVDIDHLSAKGLDIGEVRQRIESDTRTLMSFVSPSQDGLKVMFRLSERCYDAGQFAIFYKEFVKKLSLQYNLEQVVDGRTSDATRACFISVDPDAYINTGCEKVDMGEYLDLENPTLMLDMKSQQDKEEKENGKREEEATTHGDPDKDVLERIKKQLNPTKQKSEKPEAYVPQQLTAILGELKCYIEETGLIVTEMLSIQYGKKIRIKMGLKEAEINLFHGKRGFTVVKSPRCGTNTELNDVAAQLIQAFIDTR